MFTDFVEQVFKKREGEGAIGRGKHLGITAEQLLQMMRKDLNMHISRKNLWAWIEAGAIAEPDVLEGKAISKQGKRYFFSLSHVYDLMALQYTVWFLESVQRRPVLDGGRKINIADTISKLKAISQKQLLPDNCDWLHNQQDRAELMGQFIIADDFHEPSTYNLFQFLYYLYRFFRQWFYINSSQATVADVQKIVFWWECCRDSHYAAFSKNIDDDMKAAVAVEDPGLKHVSRLEILGTLLRRPLWDSHDVETELPFIQFYLDAPCSIQWVVGGLLDIIFTFSGLQNLSPFFTAEMAQALEVFLREHGAKERPRDLCTAAYLLQ